MICIYRKHKSATLAVIAILAIWCAFHLFRDKNDAGDGKPFKSDHPIGLKMSDPPAENPESSNNITVVGGNILERKCEIFNFESLSIGGLGKLLDEEFGLALAYPPRASSLKVTALERGGEPLGEILAQLFSPYQYAYYRQGKSLQVIPAQSVLVSVESTNALRRDFKTTVQTHWSEPFDLWIDLIPPLNLRVEAQPLFGESGGQMVRLTVEGRRSGRVWFYHLLEAPVGEISHVESKSKELIRVFVTPKALDKTDFTLDVRLEHETLIPVD